MNFWEFIVKIKMQAVSDSALNISIRGDLELQEAHRARKEERYIDTLVWYEKSATLSNPKAMWELSKLYDEEVWGLMNIMGQTSDELCLKAAELGFEPAMMDYIKENHQEDLTKSKYYQQLVESKDPYVIAELHYLQMMKNWAHLDYPDIKISLKLYQEAIDAGYLDCYAEIYLMPQKFLSIKERSKYLLNGASAGDAYLQWQLGLSCDIRSEEPRLIFESNDREALRWYSKAIKQFNKSAMKSAQTIYFDQNSECYDRQKGVELVVLISTLGAERQLSAPKEDYISRYSIGAFKVLLRRFRVLGISHKLSDDDLREIWVYGRLLVKFPVIVDVLEFDPSQAEMPIAKRCLTLYSECTRKARQIVVAFLLAWRRSPELWILNRDVATIIAKALYASRSEPRQWLSIMNLQAMTK